MAGPGVPAGIGGIDPVHIGQQHQQVRADQLGHPRGETVIVPVADLLRGHGVVLVDHRDGPQVQQGAHRRPGVQPPAAGLGIVAGDEDLGGHGPHGGQGLFPGPHQQALPGGGGGLLLVEHQLAAAEAQAPPSQGHGTGGHDQHALPPRPQAAHIGGEAVQPGLVHIALARIHKQGRADLHHQGARRREGLGSGIGRMSHKGAGATAHFGPGKGPTATERQKIARTGRPDRIFGLILAPKTGTRRPC